MGSRGGLEKGGDVVVFKSLGQGEEEEDEDGRKGLKDK